MESLPTTTILKKIIYTIQKQPLRGVPRKRCSENMQQIYRRTPMLKCDFNKVALLCNFIEITLQHGCFWRMQILPTKKQKENCSGCYSKGVAHSFPVHPFSTP